MFSRKDCKKNEILRIPHKNYENHENLKVLFHNNENYEIHRISNKNLANHKKLNIPCQNNESNSIL